MSFLDRIMPHLARIFLVGMFPFSGLDKIVHWDLALQQAASSFLPAAPLLLVLGMIVEFVTPVCIVLRIFDRLAAFVLAGFCVLTAVLYHDFWNYPGLFAPGGGPALDHFWEFLKNFGLAGGLMFVMLGARTKPFGDFARHPLSRSGEPSDHPVAARAPATLH
jgi:putative oxidoreductase